MSYYECKRCNFRSKQKTGMIRHLTRKNKCIKNIQSYKYSDDELYNLSLILIKEDELNKASLNKCSLCDKNFSTKGNLKKHIKKHEDGTIPYNQNLLDDTLINTKSGKKLAKEMTDWKLMNDKVKPKLQELVKNGFVVLKY